MNAGELVVSLILNVNRFKAQLQDAQREFDTVQAVAHSAGTGISDASDKSAAAISEISASARDAGRDILSAAERGAADIGNLGSSARDAGGELEDAGKRGGRGLDDIRSSARDAGKELERAAARGSDGFERMRGTLAKVVGIIGGIAFLKDQLSGYADAVKDVEEGSKALGMDIKTFQGWQSAAREVGLESKELVDLIGDVGDKMQDAVLHDSGPFKDAIEDMGLSLQGVKDGAITSSDMLLRLSKTVENLSADKGNALLRQYGFQPDTIKMIMLGEKRLKELIKTGKEKAWIDQKDIENAAKQRKALQEMSVGWQKAAAAFAGIVSPAISIVAKVLAKLFELIEENKQFVIIAFTTFATIIGVVMRGALMKMAEAAWAAMAPLAPFLLIAGALALVIDDLITYIQGGESAFGDFWKMFGTGDEIGARFKALWEGIKSILESVGAALKAVAKFFILIFSLTGQGVVKAVEGIWKGVTKLYDVLRSMLDWVAKKLYNLLPDWIKKWLGGDESSRPEETKAEAKTGGVADSMRVDDVRPSILPPQVRAGDARPGSVSNVNNSSRQTVFNNDIEIVTQATDGQGVANDLDKVWRSQTFQSDSAFGY